MYPRVIRYNGGRSMNCNTCHGIGVIADTMDWNGNVLDCPNCEGCGKNTHIYCMAWGYNACKLVKQSDEYNSDETYQREKSDDLANAYRNDPVPYLNWEN